MRTPLEAPRHYQKGDVCLFGKIHLVVMKKNWKMGKLERVGHAQGGEALDQG